MEKEVIKILKSIFKIKKSFSDTQIKKINIKNLDNYDSLNFLNFITKIENKYKLKINKSTLPKFYNFKTIIKFLKKK
tara:strand:- start:21 stop:251 length:231 start_codon:yes stop_codon:yes gene_type:complete